MAIYNNKTVAVESMNESLISDIKAKMSGLTLNKDPEQDYYDIIEKVLDDVEKFFKDFEVHRTIWDRNQKYMKDNKAFNNSLKKAREKVKAARNNNDSSLNLQLNLLYMSPKYKPNKVIEGVSRIYGSHGFRMEVSDSFLKNLFTTPFMFKRMGDNNLTVSHCSIAYMTQAGGINQGFTSLKMRFISAKNDEKSKKRLNIKESASIFDGIDFE